MLKKLRKRVEEIRNQKLKHFEDFHQLILKIANHYAALFPNFTENHSGSHYVYNFGVDGLFPFTVVKEHAGRDCQSPKAAKSAINAIEDVLDFIESTVSESQEQELEGDSGDESRADTKESARPLPEPEVPD